MRGAGILSVGGPVSDIDLPDPRPLADDEVLIAVRAAGVADWDESATWAETPPSTREGTALGGEMRWFHNPCRGEKRIRPSATNENPAQTRVFV